MGLDGDMRTPRPQSKEGESCWSIPKGIKHRLVGTCKLLASEKFVTDRRCVRCGSQLPVREIDGVAKKARLTASRIRLVSYCLHKGLGIKIALGSLIILAT